MTRLQLPVLALLSCSITGCELGGQRGPDPVVLRLENLERRLEAIERILANGSLVDLTLQMDDVQRQTADLQGNVEQLQYEQSSSADRQRALYADLDERMQAIEAGLQRAVASAGSARPAAGGATAAAVPVPGGSDQQNYQAAFGLLREQRYDDAQQAFAAFLETWPESQLVDNAQYWLAETHYVTGDYEQALVEFQKVLDNYPRSRKLSDALLKIGFCHYEQENWPEARIALGRVRAEHPDTSAASLAEQRLQRMDSEGH